MYSSIVYGYGFEIGNVTNKQIYNFMKNHKTTIEQLDNNELSDFINASDVTPDDINNMNNTFVDFESECPGDSGFYSIISSIMCIETGIGFGYFEGMDGCIGSQSICLPNAQPWQYNDTERVLTKEKLTNILTKYKDELGITSPIEHLAIEYFS